MKSKLSRTFSLLTMSAVFIFITAVPAYATDEKVTNEIDPMKTEHQWFYWPGWAFAGLTLVVVALVLFSWWKLVLEPKYRGRKVAQ